MPVATYSTLMWEAADEIERLRTALGRLLDCSSRDQECYNEEAHDIAENKARALLGARFVHSPKPLT
jgi:hypothetical protein